MTVLIHYILHSLYRFGPKNLPLGFDDQRIGGSFEALQDAVSDGAGVLQLLQEEDVDMIGAGFGAQRLHDRRESRGRLSRRRHFLLTGKAGNAEGGGFGTDGDDQLVVRQVEAENLCAES